MRGADVRPFRFCSARGRCCDSCARLGRPVNTIAVSGIQPLWFCVFALYQGTILVPATTNLYEMPRVSPANYRTHRCPSGQFRFRINGNSVTSYLRLYPLALRIKEDLTRLLQRHMAIDAVAHDARAYPRVFATALCFVAGKTMR